MKKVKMIKVSKNPDQFFEKLEKVKKLYGIATYTRAIEHLCDIAISQEENKSFAKL